MNPYPWQAAERLAATLGVPSVAAMVLAGRGMADPGDARRFLECAYPLPDPFLFQHMAQAVEILGRGIDEGSRVIVHGDYDADGITGTALLLLALRSLGLEAEWYLPSRFEEGYGLSRRAVETIASHGPGILVTVDCGVNYPDEVALALESGLEVVVVDHHEPGPKLPECPLIHSVAGEYPNDDLCGVGLALKVMHALHVARHGADREVIPEALRGLLDLVAIGTIADLAPLRGENRYYVREGLKLIEIGNRLGIRALAEVSGCVGAVDSGSVAYRLAPRLNAAGRLADPTPPLRLLLASGESEAAKLAGQLHELNGARQEVERRIFEQAVEKVDALPRLPPVIVLAEPEWHEGVVGIVASRMVERYQRPSVLLGVRDGVAKGSGRSIPGYDLLSGLVEGERLLTVYGGHTQAVGLTMSAERVDEFRASLEAHAAQAIDPADLVPTYRADAILRGQDMDADTALALASLGPFGSGNPRPRLLLVDAALRDVEATRNGAHLRCTVQLDGARARAIAFGMGSQQATLGADPEGYLVGAQLRVDEWKGIQRAELVVERVGKSPREGPLLEAAAGLLEADEESDTSHSEVTPWGGTPPALRDGRGVTVSLPPAHDLRDQGGRLGALAQVVATRESVAVLTSSLPHLLPELVTRVPLGALAKGEVAWRGRWSERSVGGAEGAAVTLLEWDLAAGAGIPAGAKHAVALDPPYRPEHVGILDVAHVDGATIHLLYGGPEREATVDLLKYLVHPRFAMVCVYRALQEGAKRGPDLLARAACIGWREAKIVLGVRDLERALLILDELGVERHSTGEAKLEARNVTAYGAAEAEYEECVRLCLTL